MEEFQPIVPPPGGLFAPGAAVPAFKALPLMLYIPRFWKNSDQTQCYPLVSFAVDWLGEPLNTTAWGPPSRRTFDVVLTFPPPLTLERLDAWTSAEFGAFLKANGPFSDEFCRAVEDQCIDGVAVLGCTPTKLTDIASLKAYPFGHVERLQFLVTTLRTRYERRRIPFGYREQKFRCQMVLGLSMTLVDLLTRQDEVFPDMSVTAYLQKVNMPMGGNPQVDYGLTGNRPEGDVLWQFDLRNVQVVACGPQQGFSNTNSVPTSCQTVNLWVSLALEADSVVLHQKLGVRDVYGVNAWELPGLTPGPRGPTLPSYPGVSVIFSRNSLPRTVKWDAYRPVSWSREIHCLLPRQDRVVIRELFRIRSLHQGSVLKLLDMNVMTKMCTLVMDAPYIYPVNLYPNRNDVREEVISARKLFLEMTSL